MASEYIMRTSGAKWASTEVAANSGKLRKGGQILIWFFLLAGAAACPFAFTHLWPRKWFRVLWWIAIAAIIGGFFNRDGY
jgi:hypothetical protein